MTNPERKRLRSPHQPTGTWIRPWRRLAIYLRDRFHCVHCGRDLSRKPPHLVTLDHVVPLSRSRKARGGPNRTANLVTSCRPCNDSRGELPLVQWYLTRPYQWRRRTNVTRTARYWAANIRKHAARSIQPHVALAKALTSAHAWPIANVHARATVRKES